MSEPFIETLSYLKSPAWFLALSLFFYLALVTSHSSLHLAQLAQTPHLSRIIFHSFSTCSHCNFELCPMCIILKIISASERDQSQSRFSLDSWEGSWGGAITDKIDSHLHRGQPRAVCNRAHESRRKSSTSKAFKESVHYGHLCLPLSPGHGIFFLRVTQ